MGKLYKYFVILSLFSFGLLLSSCAYRWGNSERSLHGGYRRVYIPLFKNYSMEPGIEVPFTNAIRQEFERSKIARVSDLSKAEIKLEGEITAVNYKLLGTKKEIKVNVGGDQLTGPVISTQYSIIVEVHVTLKKAADQSTLWEGNFSREGSYIAPGVTQGGVNTVNPLYNLSARRQNLEILAASIMNEAHDRMTENF